MRAAPTLTVLLSLSALALPASAQNIIKQPGNHPDYTFEAEPHIFLLPIDPPGASASSGWGPGFRGTFVIVDNGFVKTINNSVGVGVGMDWVAFGDATVIWVPVVMQWNFWLSRSWSVFGEPGAGFFLGNSTGVRPALYGGGRFHFSDKIALTLRAGYPAISAGVSFAF